MIRIRVLIAFITIAASGCITPRIQNSTFVKSDSGGKIISSEAINGKHSRISGLILDSSTKEHVASAKVTLWDTDRVVSTITTDKKGEFQFKNVEAGKYVIQASYIGYSPLQLDLSTENRSPFDIRVVMELESAGVILEKPVIYIYPETRQEVLVRLDYQGKLLHSYPAIYDSEWHVTANTDGTLLDKGGMEYYALFWEGKPENQIVPDSGFVVAGHDVARFLEEKLEYLGLNRREANEFIMYWLPRMEVNPFNLVHFASSEYTRSAQLLITPEPETVIRVMMLTRPLLSRISFPKQDLTHLKKTRKGFTVVEWGGTEVQAGGL